MAHEGTRAHGAGSASGTRTRGPGLDFTTYGVLFSLQLARSQIPRSSVCSECPRTLASRFSVCRAHITRGRMYSE